MLKSALLTGLLAAASAAPAAETVKPLFASDEPIHITIRGNVERVARADRSAREPGTLTVAGTALPISLSPRGITRRQRDVCQFPPLRVDLTQGAPAGSLFAGQKRLKLVTHCRASASFQNYVLLEYSAYRLYNLLTPLSFKVRLAQIDYVDGDGSPIISRLGFFIEDADDVARRNGLRELKLGTRFPVTRLSPEAAARFAIFEYMIGNLDWAMQAGPAGDDCCHNSKPIGEGPASNAIVPLPYDFDFSGLVNAPYATPPEAVPVSSVRQRRYRGLCRHNAQAYAQLPLFRATRADASRIISTLPGIDSGSAARANRYLDEFYRDIATDQQAASTMLKTCLG